MMISVPLPDGDFQLVPIQTGPRPPVPTPGYIIIPLSRVAPRNSDMQFGEDAWIAVPSESHWAKLADLPPIDRSSKNRLPQPVNSGILPLTEKKLRQAYERYLTQWKNAFRVGKCLAIHSAMSEYLNMLKAQGLSETDFPGGNSSGNPEHSH